MIVDVPAPVVPYMPPATHRDKRRRVQIVQMPEPGVQVVNKESSPATPASADFDSFEAAPAKKSGDMTPVPEFHETDRIDQQNVLLQVSYLNSRRKKTEEMQVCKIPILYLVSVHTTTSVGSSLSGPELNPCRQTYMIQEAMENFVFP